MRFRLGRPLIIVLLIAVAVVLFFVFRSRTRADYGPAAALCPGPDLYGYTCESGEGYAYLDATIDTMLYQDDGVVPLDLPFPFLFYGTNYNEVYVSSNGNMQFGNANASYFNDCLNSGPVPDMGDMIAPYWDDLDLRFEGYLEYETFGTAPERIFVVEWDNIPRFGGDSSDRVTFEVQLHERTHDLVFLYEDVTTIEGYNGSSATIGLQSELQELALQYGCFQPVVANASRIRFPHPQLPNSELGLQVVFEQAVQAATRPTAKGHVEELIAGLEQLGPASLPGLRNHWLGRTPPRLADWRWLDLDGDSRDELVLLWRGSRQNPELSELVILSTDPGGNVSLLMDESLSTRHEQLPEVTFSSIADLTHDGNVDVLLLDSQTGSLMVVSAELGEPAILTVPERCQGELAVVDSDSDERLEIIRSGCDSQDRTAYLWIGGDFVPAAASTGD